MRRRSDGMRALHRPDRKTEKRRLLAVFAHAPGIAPKPDPARAAAPAAARPVSRPPSHHMAATSRDDVTVDLDEPTVVGASSGDAHSHSTGAAAAAAAVAEANAHADGSAGEEQGREHLEPGKDEVWGIGGADGPLQKEKRYSTLTSAFMVLTTWSTSSSNVLYPYVFGVLGVVGGPLMMAVAFVVQWRATRWTVQAARATHSETFGALGEALLGRRGRIMFEGSQILFQQLFLPVAIVLCANAVQSLASFQGVASCNGNVAVLLAAVGLALVQVSRELENVTAIAYVSCFLMVVMTLSIAAEVSTRDAPVADGGSSNITTVSANGTNTTAPASWELFVGMGDHPERYQWANVLSAIGIFIYSCLPSCIVVETMATLKPADREKMKYAVDGSFAAYAVVYLVAGLPAVLQWGGDLPVPIEFDNTPLGVLIKVILIFGTLLDFVLASTTVNRWVLRVRRVEFDYKWTLRNAAVWLQYSWPSCLIAVAMALLIPRLESLTGLLDSIAGSTLQLTATPLALWLTTNTDVRSMSKAAGKRAFTVFSASAVYGILFTVLVLVAACYTIGATRYVAVDNETFWCDLAG